MRAQSLSLEEMKATLLTKVGSKYPLKIKKNNAETLIAFVRGFADEKHNILLISQSPDSLSMNILEVRHINDIIDI